MGILIILIIIIYFYFPGRSQSTLTRAAVSDSPQKPRVLPSRRLASSSRLAARVTVDSRQTSSAPRPTPFTRTAARMERCSMWKTCQSDRQLRVDRLTKGECSVSYLEAGGCCDKVWAVDVARRDKMAICIQIIQPSVELTAWRGTICRIMVARSDGQCHLFVSFRDACILHVLPANSVPQLPLNIVETPIELGHARAAPEPILLQSLRSLCNCLEVFW